MHIGLICYEYPPALHGGVGTFSRDLAESLVSLGHEVTVIGVYVPRLMSLKHTTKEVINGVNVIRIPSATQFPSRIRMFVDRFRLRSWLRKYHKERPFDIIEAPDSTGWMSFTKLHSAATIIRLHGSQIYFDFELKRIGSRLLHIFERMALTKADYVAAVSNYVGIRTSELVGELKPYHVIYNAVDVEAFSPREDIDIESGLIAYSGSLLTKKGVIELARAMNLVWRMFPDTQVVMIGKDGRNPETSEAMSEYLLSLMEESQRGNITFTGHVSHEVVADYLYKANVCCYPSHAESFGIAPVEAMSMGKAVIYMEHGPGSEVIENGVSGLLCNTRSPEDIAEKIITLLRNPELAVQLGKNARQRVLNMFDRRDWVDKNLQFYEACLRDYNSSHKAN